MNNLQKKHNRYPGPTGNDLNIAKLVINIIDLMNTCGFSGTYHFQYDRYDIINTHAFIKLFLVNGMPIKIHSYDGSYYRLGSIQSNKRICMMFNTTIRRNLGILDHYIIEDPDYLSLSADTTDFVELLHIEIPAGIGRANSVKLVQ